MTPQELKNSILQLAIQGKLVEQRTEEGTAAELLRDILTQRHIYVVCQAVWHKQFSALAFSGK